jgi:hypothetical protein
MPGDLPHPVAGGSVDRDLFALGEGEIATRVRLEP